jgi:hypothetical protein
MRIYAAGARVRQPQYGAGTVTEANERHTVIDFDEHGIRTFVTMMVTLESTNEPAPPSRKPAKAAARRSRKRTPASESSTPS